MYLSDTRGISRTSTTSKVELSVTIGKKFQPLTHVKKTPIFQGFSGFKLPLCRHCEIRKDSKIWEKSLQELWKSLFLVKSNLPCRFTNEEMRFITFKDLPCILRSKRIFRQYVKLHAFSTLATQLTRWAVRLQKVWNFNRALTQNGLNIWVYY